MNFHAWDVWNALMFDWFEFSRQKCFYGISEIHLALKSFNFLKRARDIEIFEIFCDYHHFLHFLCFNGL